jgi:hypothetical protein
MFWWLMKPQDRATALPMLTYILGCLFSMIGIGVLEEDIRTSLLFLPVL